MRRRSAPPVLTRRTIGVEEEFLLVDRAHGRVVAVGGAVLRAAGDDSEVTGELQREQLETGTRPCSDLADLGRERAEDLVLVELPATARGGRPPRRASGTRGELAGASAP